MKFADEYMLICWSLKIFFLFYSLQFFTVDISVFACEKTYLDKWFGHIGVDPVMP
jgi:hypothetical protein